MPDDRPPLPSPEDRASTPGWAVRIGTSPAMTVVPDEGTARRVASELCDLGTPAVLYVWQDGSWTEAPETAKGDSGDG